MMYVEKGNRQLQEQINILKVVNSQINQLENGDRYEKAFNDSDFDQDVDYIKKQINSHYKEKNERENNQNSKRRLKTDDNTLLTTINNNNTQESDLFLTANNQTQNDSTYFPRLNSNNMSINNTNYGTGISRCNNKSRHSIILE